MGLPSTPLPRVVLRGVVWVERAPGGLFIITDPATLCTGSGKTKLEAIRDLDLAIKALRRSPEVF